MAKKHYPRFIPRSLSGTLSGTVDALREWRDENEEHESVDDAEAAACEIEDAASDVNDVTFPGMYG